MLQRRKSTIKENFYGRSAIRNLPKDLGDVSIGPGEKPRACIFRTQGGRALKKKKKLLVLQFVKRDSESSGEADRKLPAAVYQ